MSWQWQEIAELEASHRVDEMAGIVTGAQRRFIVHAPPEAREQDVLSHASAPKPGDEHPRISGLVCLSVRARKRGPVWYVEADYGEVGIEIVGVNPLDRTPRITWTTVPHRVIVTEDVNGPIVNTAGDPFDPPLEVDIRLLAVEVQYNATSVPTWFLSYRHAINSTPWYIDGVVIPAYYARMDDLQVGPWQRHQSIWYREVSYRAIIGPEPWIPRILNAGYHELVYQDERVIKRPIIIEGSTPSQPIPLDMEGRAIKTPRPEDIIWRYVLVYPQLDFNALPGSG